MTVLISILSILGGLCAGAAYKLTRLSLATLSLIIYPVGFVLLLRSFTKGAGPTGAAITEASTPGASDPAMIVTAFIVFTIFAVIGAILIDPPERLKQTLQPILARTFDWRTPFEQFNLLWGDHKRKSQQSAAPKLTVYYEAVLRFGALIASADDTGSEAEFATLSRFFGITDASVPGARATYDAAIAEPKRIPTILRRLKVLHPAGAPALETFLMGMCQVALADNRLHRREVFLLKRAAEYLGFSRLETLRILLAAGITERDMHGYFKHDYRRVTDDSDETYKRQKGYTAADKPGGFLSERTMHLAVLGLEAGAKPEDIKSAYRTLAKKYHPDKIQSQGLPEVEMQRAEDMMVKINAAYAALTD